MPTFEPIKISMWCKECSKETEHYDINYALRICSACGNEIHGSDNMPEAKNKMARLTESQKADIHKLWKDGVPAEELATTYGKSIWTIRGLCKGIKRARVYVRSEAAPARDAVGAGPVVKTSGESGVMVEIRLRLSDPVTWPPNKNIAERYRMELERVLRSN